MKEAKDGLLVRRLRDAGAIVLGVTNVPQLLIYHESDNPLYGRCNNPWSLDRTPGGSSGGEASIVAAGGSTMGLGSDIGGSLRVPAHFAGLQTLKPTSGRLSSLDLLVDLFASGQEAILAQAGPLARRVEDVELMLRVLAAPGQEQADPAVPPVAWREPGALTLSGLRVGMYVDDGFFPAAPAVRRAVDAAGAALRGLGVHVEPFAPPRVADAIRIFFGILGADGGAWARRALRGNPHDRRVDGLLQVAGMPNAVRGGVAAGAARVGQKRLAETILSLKPISADGYWQLTAQRTRYRDAFLRAMDSSHLDALICPPHALPALKHGASYYLFTAGSYSILYNLLGMPAGVVAATRVRAGEESDRAVSRDIVERTARQVERGSAGLPIGVQIAARHWREDVVLALMPALEAHFRQQPDYPAAPPIA
jgi:fatty acid amide hydrolase